MLNILTVAHLDRDEVGLAFIGNSFSQQGLSTARGAIEQNPLRGGHAKLKELLWMLNRVLYRRRNVQ